MSTMREDGTIITVTFVDTQLILFAKFASPILARKVKKSETI